MDANQTSLFNLMDGQKQLTVPIYQRAYSWQESHCGKLISDIYKASQYDNNFSHFMGAIVCCIDGNIQVAGVNNFLVIDGQQRLTSVSLLILSLCDYLYENNIGEIDGGEVCRIRELWTVNYVHQGDSNYFKLNLGINDGETYNKIVLRQPLDENNRKTNIFINYKYFYDKFGEIYTPSNNYDVDDKYLPNDIYNGIQRLQLVQISLDIQRDNPQLIFESMNSTGLDLTKSDLIRNYILMGLSHERQRELYGQFWLPMESLFEKKYGKLFDTFMKTYLTVKTGRYIKEKNIYNDFKNYAFEYISNNRHDELLEDLYYLAVFYTNFSLLKDTDRELRECFLSINRLKTDVIFPFLLKLYILYKSEILTKCDFINIIKLSESYIFRKIICALGTKSIGSSFIILLNKMDEENICYSVQVIYKEFTRQKRFPSDDEFIDALENKDVYNLETSKAKYLLDKIENSYNPNQPINSSYYNIEHIMPQCNPLPECWVNEIGDNWQEVFDNKLHTIGNLTLTGYNSSLSNRSFVDKKNLDPGGFSVTNLSLNILVREAPIWNEEVIIQRAKVLSGKACEIWGYPAVEINEIEGDNDENYGMDFYKWNDSIRSIYQIFEERIEQLHNDIKVNFTMHYICFKLDSSFVDIVPFVNSIKLYLNIDFQDIDDPKGYCIDKTGVGHLGTGNVEITVDSDTDVDDIIILIQQALDKAILN